MTVDDACRGEWMFDVRRGWFQCSCCSARAPRVLVERWAEDTPTVMATAARFYAWQTWGAEDRALDSAA